jgi:NADH-quinone oxidoreductase subunit F
LLDSLEGKRGHPRLKPPFPASVGLFGAPTVINNVETLANVPAIILRGADGFISCGLSRDGGMRLFGVSGSVCRPGVYELPVGTSLREIIFTHAGGMLPGRKLKAVIPGGLSAPLLRPEEIDLGMDCDSLAGAGSMLGSGGIIVIDDATPMREVLFRTAKFYAHESCGQCTPCRLGTAWILKIARRIASGRGVRGDIGELTRLANGLKGKTLCPMGDAAALPILAIAAKFKEELEG